MRGCGTACRCWPRPWTRNFAAPQAVQEDSVWEVVWWQLAGGIALALGLIVVNWVSCRGAAPDARQEAATLPTERTEMERLHGGLPAIIFLREFMPDGTNRLIYRGGDLEAVIGWPLATFADVDNFHAWVDLPVDDYHAFFERVMREGVGTIEYRMRQPDGSWRTLRSRWRMLARRDDGTCEVAGYILDVSAERAAEARAFAAARLASLGEIAGGLAHEIKQPLQSISLAAELAQLAIRKGDASQVDALLEQIVEQTQRTADVIDQFRRFARVAEEGAALEAVSLAEAAGGALQLARSVLYEAEIRVEIALSEPPPVVRGQAVLLKQVLLNLLLNARDAIVAQPAGTPRQIRITAAAAPDDVVEITVADTGGGIAPAIMARLFEPFVTTKGPDTGTGLGLSICHRHIQEMNGRIHAHNSAEGAVFTIALPRSTEGEPMVLAAQ
jgi:signal transduction histidine kinase